LVLGKAVSRAAEQLGLSQQQLAAVVGTSTATISRVANGARGLDPSSKEGELALLFVRVFRSLDALVGGDAAKARAWLHAENTAFAASPASLLSTIEGLVNVAIYLDAMRGRL
jgi:transcriptional regulator with XRE-family HTH domain